MIYKIANQIGKKIVLKKVLPIKLSARNSVSYVCEIESEELFLIVIAKTPVQIFQLKMSVKRQKEFQEEFGEQFFFNMPVYTGSCDTAFYAIFQYFANVNYPARIDHKPVEKMVNLYSKYGTSYKVNDELINKIEVDFLSVWPSEFHEIFKSLALYKKYFLFLRTFKELVIYKEHGQYGYSNILYLKKKYYLVDFEFSKNFQPLWFDCYNYFNLMPQFKRLVERKKYEKNDDLKKSELKSKLEDEMFRIIDDACIPKIKKIDSGKFNLIKKIESQENRFDYIYGSDFDLYEINELNVIEYIPVHINKSNAIIGVSFIKISSQGFRILIEKLFYDYHQVNNIHVRNSYNYYIGLSWELFSHADQKLVFNGIIKSPSLIYRIVRIIYHTMRQWGMKK